MKSNIVSFIAGVIVCFIGMISFWDLKETSYPQQQYEDQEKRERYIKYLEESGILYTYKIDHLKRHWVIPYINKESDRSEVIANFKASEEERAKKIKCFNKRLHMTSGCLHAYCFSQKGAPTTCGMRGGRYMLMRIEL